jgi:hypothetical protein
MEGEEKPEKERLSEENNHHKIAPTSVHMVFSWASFCLAVPRWEHTDRKAPNPLVERLKTQQESFSGKENDARERERKRRKNILSKRHIGANRLK